MMRCHVDVDGNDDDVMLTSSEFNDCIGSISIADKSADKGRVGSMAEGEWGSGDVGWGGGCVVVDDEDD